MPCCTGHRLLLLCPLFSPGRMIRIFISTTPTWTVVLNPMFCLFWITPAPCAGNLDGNKKSSKPSRMKIMQDAFQDIMANSSGLNVGLMKLWARGEESSKLTFPITDIDQTMGRSPIILDGNPEIANSSDDGYEGSDGTVSLLSESIPLGGDNSGTGSGSSSGVRSFKITQFQDNAEGDVDWYYFVGNDSAANEMRFDNRARYRRNTLYFQKPRYPKKCGQ